MKKILIPLLGLAVAGCSTLSPVYADVGYQRVIGQPHDNGNHYGRYKNQRDYYGRSYGYYSRYPSYYPGRCYNDYYTVIVRDPYTGRLVCMPRYDYDRSSINIRIR